MNAEHRQRKIDKIKEQNKQRIVEKRKEAEAAVDLMSAQYERICEEEERRKGLIIVSAKYGKFDNDSNTSPTTPSTSSSFSQYEDIIIDVTIPLQCLIRDSRLKLHKASKVIIIKRLLTFYKIIKLLIFLCSQCELPGFYDPCVGEDKQLHIDYTYKDVSHRIVIADNEEVRLPII